MPIGTVGGGMWCRLIRDRQFACCVWRRVLILVAVVVTFPPATLKAEDTEAVEYFEKSIRPLLAAKCQSCHGEKKAKGGLRLTDRRTLLDGGESGPAVVPGRGEESLLIRAVRYLDEPKMPPQQKLSDGEIAALERWVGAGAIWPTSEPSSAATHPEKAGSAGGWWAFQPVGRPPAPAGKVDDERGNEIDRFLVWEWKARGILPASVADRQTWIRRATFDLTGLPPTPHAVAAFVADRSESAFERVVDRLLGSPAYGERWARHWLDVARYADYYDPDPKTRTASCELTEAWRYRDWVVGAFNGDLPFDQFIVHQIAGDLLPAPDHASVYPAGLIATTFLSNGVWDRGDADKEKIVSDMVDDQIDTVGKAFLGLTLGCARCHDHKYDPVSQADYYALAGIFYSTHLLKDLGAKGAEYVMNRVPLVPRAQVDAREAKLRLIAELEAKLATIEKTPQAADGGKQRAELVAERDRLVRDLPSEPPLAMAVQEGGTPGGLFSTIQDVPIHIRGSYARLGPKVARRMPLFLSRGVEPAIRQGSGRQELARWVASSQNPLTARVIVNRVWQWHFGEGLVRTPSNFGMRSEPPSHPKLLDWLAARFVDDGWSLKRLHRRIMLSAAYQRASVATPDQVFRDPENRWLGRFSPRRLDAEEVRDAMLSVSGGLDRKAGGPAADGIDTPRRSLYVQTARWDRSSFAMLFDAANPDSSTEKRTVSTVAPQALTFLNHAFVFSQSRALSQRLDGHETGKDDRIDQAYQLLFGRSARAEERVVCDDFLARSARPGHATDWSGLIHLLLCTNEFMYVD
jgi:cytochrome c553